MRRCIDRQRTSQRMFLKAINLMPQRMPIPPARGSFEHRSAISGGLSAFTVLVALCLPLTVSAQTGVPSQTAGQAAGVSPSAAPRTVQAPRQTSPRAPSAPADPVSEGSSAESAPSCSGGLPQAILVKMNAGKSTLIDLPEPVVRRTVGDPGVVDSRMVSAQVLYMASARIGSTNVILQGRSGRCVLLDVVVGIDTDAVQAKITELMPDEPNVRVTAAGDSLVLTGVVRDAAAVERAVVIANAYVRTGNRGGVSRVGGVSGASGSGGGASAGGSERADAGAAPLSARVVNLLSVSSAQQVMLEVKVAEVSKNLLDKLGASVGGIRTSGAWTYTFLTNFLSGALGATLGGINARGDQFSIEAEKRDGLVRILAEPNVMAISGQEGSFLAGGKILIPVAQASGTGAVAVTLEEKEFGVGLRFTPTVLADGRINLRVAPEVSELSRQGVGVSTGTFSSTVLPLISTRRASTTVQLFDGQSFAIGGLIKSSGASTVRALPILGELPIIGALFRSTEFQNENTELVFIVTPRLVKPLGPNYVLPTDRIGTPGRAALMLDGRLDSDGIPPVPASVSPRPAAPVFEIK